MAYEQILYSVAGAVATVTLNRPDRLNAWTPVMEKEVLDAMQQAERDQSVRVIILTGAGRGFCAGADMEALTWLKDLDMKTADKKEIMERIAPDPGRKTARPDFGTMHSYFPSIEKPIIAAINGPSVGLGLVIPLFCDIRIASSEARFGTAFARRGLIGEYGITWILPHLVGLENALDLLMSARMINADEAHRIGLVSRVVPQDQFEATVRAYATELATMASPRSMGIIKRQTYTGLFQTLKEALDMAAGEMFGAFASSDFREGVQHYLEKRPPKFTGR